MHCQKGKYAEDKVITCITGSVMVALIDIRTDSPTYLEYEKTTLDSKKKQVCMSLQVVRLVG